jgi:hypothetical protein
MHSLLFSTKLAAKLSPYWGRGRAVNTGGNGVAFGRFVAACRGDSGQLGADRRGDRYRVSAGPFPCPSLPLQVDIV